MGLEKTIVSGREHRKLYHGAKVADCNHGFCDYCKSNQLHSTRKREAAVDTHQRECDSYNSAAERTPPQLPFMAIFRARGTQIMKTIEDTL